MEVTARGVRWQVLPEWRDLLFGPEGLRLEQWLRDGLARVVKNGPHRTVYHVVLPGLSFYLKHYRLWNLRARLRQLIRPAKAHAEFERALAVADRQVSTIEPVALGIGCSRPGPGDSFLITRGLDGAEPVSTFIECTLPGLAALKQTRLRQRLAVALGEFVARLHEAGIVHHDLHAANLLVRLEAGDRPRIHLIDLHAVRLKKPLTWRASQKNLVMLNRYFSLRVSRSDRLRFWLAYCRASVKKWSGVFSNGGLPTNSRGKKDSRPLFQHRPLSQHARDLEEQTLESNLRFWETRDRRSLVSNRYYSRCRSVLAAGYAVRDLDAEALNQLLADPDGPFHGESVVLLKDSRSSTVAEFELPVNGVMRRVVYKRFRIRSWTDPWRTLFRRSAPVRSWIYGQGLRERLLPTPRPLAVFQRRCGFLAYEGYLLTEKIHDAVDLHAFLARLKSLATPERRYQLRKRIDQVAKLVRTLHERQVSQRDLKAANILLTDTAAWLIDLVGITTHRKLSVARRVQNVARLHACFHKACLLTRTDKLRFLRVYLQWGLRGRRGWKAWWRAVAKATHAKIERNQRSGRILA